MLNRANPRVCPLLQIVIPGLIGNPEVFTFAVEWSAWLTLTFCEGVAARYAVIDKLRLRYPVPFMCNFFDVSISGYYAWLNRPPSRRAQEDKRLEVEILASHERTRQTYGPERIQKDLADHGIKAGAASGAFARNLESAASKRKSSRRRLTQSTTCLLLKTFWIRTLMQQLQIRPG